MNCVGAYRGSLVVGGAFDSVDGNSVANVAYYNTSSGEWEAMGAGFNAGVYNLREMTPPLLF